MVRRKCDGCGGMYASRQSLFQHRKRCGKGVHTAVPPPIMHTGKTTTEDRRAKLHRILDQAADNPKKPSILHMKEGKRNKLTRLLEKAADDQNKDQDLEESSDSDVSSNDSEYLGSDDDDVDNFWLWEGFVMSCRRADKDVFECLEGIIPLYKWSETDELFQTLMKDVHSSIHDGFSLMDSFNIAVYTNKDAIVKAVNCGDKDDFWSAIDRAGRNLPPGCKWLTGEDCHCSECFGHSLLTKIRRFVETFYGISVDDTMQKILRSEEGGASVRKSMERYKEEILEKYEQARSLIDACNIVDDPNRPKFACSDEDD